MHEACNHGSTQCVKELLHFVPAKTVEHYFSKGTYQYCDTKKLVWGSLHLIFYDSLILIRIISCDFELSLAKEYVDDITIPTHVIKYKQSFLQVDQSFRLQYSNQIKLCACICKHLF